MKDTVIVNVVLGAANFHLNCNRLKYSIFRFDFWCIFEGIDFNDVPMT